MKVNMALERDLTIETMERIINLFQDENPTQSLAKDISCSQSAGCKLRFNYRKFTTKQTKGNGPIEKSMLVTEL